MVRKYFPFDKNYILENAQLGLERELLTRMVSLVKQHYLICNNPLGIEDDTIRSIKNCTHYGIDYFKAFYADLAGVYRFKYGQNQLEIPFDGVDHYTRYQQEWSENFTSWIKALCGNPSFVRTVLHLTVFDLNVHAVSLAQDRLKQYVSQFFDLKIYKYRGIQMEKSA